MGNKTSIPNIKSLKKASQVIEKFIDNGYGKGCKDFTWGCALCHATFVKTILRDFVNEQISIDRWHKKKDRKSLKKKSVVDKLSTTDNFSRTQNGDD